MFVCVCACVFGCLFACALSLVLVCLQLRLSGCYVACLFVCFICFLHARVLVCIPFFACIFSLRDICVVIVVCCFGGGLFVVVAVGVGIVVVGAIVGVICHCLLFVGFANLSAVVAASVCVVIVCCRVVLVVFACWLGSWSFCRLLLFVVAVFVVSRC